MVRVHPVPSREDIVDSIIEVQDDPCYKIRRDMRSSVSRQDRFWSVKARISASNYKNKIGGLILMLNIIAVIIVILIIVAVLVAYSCCIISAKDDMKKPDSDPDNEV